MLRIFFRHLCFLPLLFAFFWLLTIFAADGPNLISPPDNSSENKPKLTWEYKGECPDSGSCFRVEVDNNNDFSSPQKSSYTNSSSYSPQGLPEGEWFWRVRAKDKSDKWTEWSKIFRFVIGTVSSTIQAPTSTPSSAEPTKSENLFEIKDLKGEINSDEEVEVFTSIKFSDKPNTKFYLKGAFKKSDSSNYFGQTFVNGWVRNGSSYSNQFRMETNSEGTWEGKIKVKADQEDSGFDGTGDYVFKIGRYAESGGGPVWSNELKVMIIEVSLPSPSPSPTPEEEVEEVDEDEEVSLIKADKRNYEIKIASVAGEATKSDNMPLVSLEEEARVLEERKVNWLLIILGTGILAGGIGYVVYKLKFNKK